MPQGKQSELVYSAAFIVCLMALTLGLAAIAAGLSAMARGDMTASVFGILPGGAMVALAISALLRSHRQ